MRQPTGKDWTLAAADVLALQDAPVDKLLNVRAWDTDLLLTHLSVCLLSYPKQVCPCLLLLLLSSG